MRYVRSDRCVCSRSHGHPFGARNLAWTATSFSNHWPGVSRFDFTILLLRGAFLACFACFLRVGIALRLFPFRIKRFTLRCNYAFDKHPRNLKRSAPQRLRLATRDKLQARLIAGESTLSDHKQDEAFRVIDRRPFTAEGELRKEVVEQEEREAKREAAKVPATPSEAPKTAAAPPPAETPERIAAFENLVRMLGSNAAMVLGAYADPRTGQPMIDPEAARELIDMLDALHEKTKGNLSPEEDTLLLDLFGKLKMTYLEVNQAVAAEAAKAKARP